MDQWGRDPNVNMDETKKELILVIQAARRLEREQIAREVRAMIDKAFRHIVSNRIREQKQLTTLEIANKIEIKL